MKRLLVFIALLSIVCITAFSQTHSDSIRIMRDYVALNTDKFLTVKGVELKPGLKMNDCLYIFLSKGFKKTDIFDVIKEQNGVYNLEGSFYNRDKCRVIILPTSSNKNIVSTIGISFPNETSFKQLKTEYDNLKSALSQKYYIFESKEGFDNDYINKTTSDYLKLSALEHDEGEFKTIFYVSDKPLSLLLGQIVLSISHVNVDYETSYYVSLSYVTSDDIVEQLSSMNDDL